MTMRWSLSRRGVLLTASAGALAAGCWLAQRQTRQALATLANSHEIAELAFGDYPRHPDVWLEVCADDLVRLYAPKTEMGQGVHGALAAIAAAELGLRTEQVVVMQADTARGFGRYNLDTGGSFSLRTVTEPLRRAAAALRAKLSSAGAQWMGVPTSAVDIRDGVVSGPEGRRLALGLLVQHSGGRWPALPEDPAPRDAATFALLLRRPIVRVDLDAKIRGRAVYGFDARHPAMLYGAVAKPPRPGARLVSAARGEALASDRGLRTVIDVDRGLAGVVAGSRRAAWAALQQLDLRWEGGTEIDSADIDRLVTADTDGILVYASGSASACEKDLRHVEAEFRCAMAAHATLEPQAALVEVRPDGVRAWVSTQIPSMATQAIAEALGRPLSEVVVQPTFIGGSYGRKSGHDVAREAALLSQACGAPVHVGWTRQDEMRQDFFRPPTHHRLRAALDGDGRVRSMRHDVASGDVLLSFGANPLPGGQWLASVLGFDPGAAIGLPGPYRFEHCEVRLRRVRLPVPTGSWRGLGAIQNTFALECFMDEAAAIAGDDPIDFRLRHLPVDGEGPILARLLTALRERARWDEPGASTHRPLGVACGVYHGTPIANVVEMASTNQPLRVLRVHVAVELGQIVSRDGATAQVEGGVLWGISAALKEQVHFDRGRLVEDGLPAYPVARLEDMPEVDVLFFESGGPPRGLGEAPLIGVAPAIRNALRLHHAKALRQMPLQC